MKRITILLSVLLLFTAMGCACAVSPSDLDPNKPIYINYPTDNPGIQPYFPPMPSMPPIQGDEGIWLSDMT